MKIKVEKMYIHTYQDTSMRYVAAFSPRSGIELGWLYDLREWCKEAYGLAGARWRDQIIYGEIHFTNEEDLSLFLLRWS